MLIRELLKHTIQIVMCMLPINYDQTNKSLEINRTVYTSYHHSISSAEYSVLYIQLKRDIHTQHTIIK